MNTGSVKLVGAGPGDPELLTLKAARAIGEATLLLVDDLVGDGVLGLASAQARIVHVGKRGGCRSTSQAFIQRLMVRSARAGERVVRLKGGDPFVFGRGGEELEHLRAAGIEVEVIPGISAGLAAAAVSGVPLTHRDSAQGVVFVTGHTQPDGSPVDWPSLAGAAHRSSLTLVIYMGVRRVANLQRALLQGLPAQTPVVLVQAATLPAQRILATRLATLADDMTQAGLASPAVMVVGRVAQAAHDAAQLAQAAVDRAGPPRAASARGAGSQRAASAPGAVASTPTLRRWSASTR